MKKLGKEERDEPSTCNGGTHTQGKGKGSRDIGSEVLMVLRPPHLWACRGPGLHGGRGSRVD